MQILYSGYVSDALSLATSVLDRVDRIEADLDDGDHELSPAARQLLASMYRLAYEASERLEVLVRRYPPATFAP